VEDRLGLDQHPGPSAEGLVVDGLAAVGGEVTEVVEPDVGEPLLLGDAERPLGQEAPDDLGEEGQDVDAHRGVPRSREAGENGTSEGARIKARRYHSAVFSGIVEAMKPVVSVRVGNDARRLGIDLEELSAGVREGDSVAIDGCCLTVTGLTGSVASFDVVSETLRMTNLGSLAAGARVNVERSLRVGDQLGGHFVTGHVEGVAPIVAKEALPGETRLSVELPPTLLALV